MRVNSRKKIKNKKNQQSSMDTEFISGPGQSWWRFTLRLPHWGLVMPRQAVAADPPHSSSPTLGRAERDGAGGGGQAWARTINPPTPDHPPLSPPFHPSISQPQCINLTFLTVAINKGRSEPCVMGG